MTKRKKKVVKPQYKPTKRAISHLQRQKRRQRLTFIAGIVVVSTVVLLVGVGLITQWYIPVFRPLHQTALEVNTQKFNMDYYVKALEYYSGNEPYYAQYLLEAVPLNIQRNKLIIDNAAELGYSISNGEVADFITDNSLEDNKAIQDIVEAQLLVAKIKEDYFGTKVPTSAEHRKALAIFLESQSRAEQVIVAIEAGDDFGQLATESSLDSYTKSNNGDLGWRIYGVLDGLLDSEVMDDAVFSIEAGIFGQPVYDEVKEKDLGYWLIELLERNTENNTVHVRVMLLSSEDEAVGILARLSSGENFGQLATIFSQLEGADENMGDLDFLSVNNNYTEVFEDFVFNPATELNMVSQPLADDQLATNGGCWLYMVAEIDMDRPISDENRQLLISADLNDWISSIMEDPSNEVVNYIDDDMRLFAMDRIIAG